MPTQVMAATNAAAITHPRLASPGNAAATAAEAADPTRLTRFPTSHVRRRRAAERHDDEEKAPRRLPLQPTAQPPQVPANAGMNLQQLQQRQALQHAFQHQHPPHFFAAMPYATAPQGTAAHMAMAAAAAAAAAASRSHVASGVPPPYTSMAMAAAPMPFMPMAPPQAAWGMPAAGVPPPPLGPPGASPYSFTATATATTASAAAMAANAASATPALTAVRKTPPSSKRAPSAVPPVVLEKPVPLPPGRLSWTLEELRLRRHGSGLYEFECGQRRTLEWLRAECVFLRRGMGPLRCDESIEVLRRVRVRFERALAGDGSALPETLGSLSMIRRTVVPAVHWLLGMGEHAIAGPMGLEKCGGYGGRDAGVMSAVLEEAARLRGVEPLTAAEARELRRPPFPRYAEALLLGREAQAPGHLPAANEKELVAVARCTEARRAVTRRRLLGLQLLMGSKRKALELSANLTGERHAPETDPLYGLRGVASNYFHRVDEDVELSLYWFLARLASRRPDMLGEHAPLGGKVTLIPFPGVLSGDAAARMLARTAELSKKAPAMDAFSATLMAPQVGSFLNQARAMLGWSWTRLWAHLGIGKANSRMSLRCLLSNDIGRASYAFVTGWVAAQGLPSLHPDARSAVTVAEVATRAPSAGSSPAPSPRAGPRARTK